MPGVGMGLTLWTAKHRSTRSKSSISSIPRTPTSPSAVHDGFGIPSPDDPDPFGVRALEEIGLRIKEAGTERRPTSDAFDYKPSPTSPAFRLSTQSIDAAALRDSRRNSKRDSKRSCLSVDHGTQTANLPSPPIDARELCRSPPPIEEEPQQESIQHSIEEEQPVETTAQNSSEGFVEETDHRDAEDDIEISDEEPIVIVEEAKPSFQGLTRAQASPIETKAKIVNITKRGPPALPVKSPLRQRVFQAADPVVESDLQEEDLKDDSSSTYSSSPAKSSFDKDECSTTPWSAQTSIQDTESLQHKDEFLPDLDVPPLDDEDDGDSLAESEATHHDGSQQTEPQTTPYTMGELNTSGETLAVSVQAGDDHKPRKESVDSIAHVSHESITHLIPEAPIHSPAEISETASVSSFYEEDEAGLAPEKEAFHSTSSILPVSTATQEATA